MNHITTFKQLEDTILNNGITDQELRITLGENSDSSLRFGIACYLDDQMTAKDIADEISDINTLIEMVPQKNKNVFLDILISRALKINNISNTNDAKTFLVTTNLSIELIENSLELSLLQKSALAIYLNPKKIKDNSWSTDIIDRFDINEMTPYLQDYHFLLNVLPLNPSFFVKKILKADSLVIQNYVQALLTTDFSLEEMFDAIASLKNNQILGSILIKKDDYLFDFEDGVQESLFNSFGLKLNIIETDAIFTEKEMGATKIGAELFFKNGKITADLKSDDLTTLESFKSQLYSVLATAVTTVGKVVSNPKTKVALMAISALGVLGEAWGAENGSEGDIAKILNKLEKAHTLKGFEGGKQYSELDAQLEQVGADLNDIKFPPIMNQRSINFSGEEGDYTLRIGDSQVKFEYNDDGFYTYGIKNNGQNNGIISSEDLLTWAKKITNNLNKAVKANE